MSLAIEFFFDPACPWTWMTSRWVSEVAPARDLTIDWRSYSLLTKNGESIAAQFRPAVEATYGVLRIAEALRADGRAHQIGALYTHAGAAVHHDGDRTLTTLPAVLEGAGVEATYLAAATDRSWDAAVDASTHRGVELVGADVGIPIIAIPGHTPYFGPVVTPPPTGEDALRLWDIVIALGGLDGVYEIKRSRGVGPQFGPDPR